MEDKPQKLKFYSLDNAGVMYTAIASSRMSTVYRMTVGLNEVVDPAMLQKALDVIIPRFPYFQVTLKRGLFWYYYEHTEVKPKVEEETFYPCKIMRQRQGKTFPFRVLYYNSYVHVEFNHSICDGSGGLIFLQTLIIQYFKENKGITPVNRGKAMDIDSEIDPREYEDAFKLYYKEGVPPPPGNKKVYHFPFELLDKGEYLLLTGIVPVDQILGLARKYGCTLTQFMLALYFESIQEYIQNSPMSEKKKHQQRIAINVPVDLRKIFPSITLRNFFMSLNPEIDLALGYFTREEIIEQIKGYMGLYLNRKNINRYISRNVRNEQLIFLRLIPLWVKKLAMPIVYKRFGERGYTSGLSNLGNVSFPEELVPYIKSLEVFPPPSVESRLKLVMVSYNKNLSLSFGKTSGETVIEKIFFRKIRQLGIPVKIVTNKR
ncbi:hypothetical protein [Acetobacterium bakii]|uniref:Alcohol acetyltransferase n=1 Tax=Acetobacterium bakii TaxID=52689 RepID=A0A0L6U1H4_9FIRM|nr:hypothetical protein [Acetobacterium bakii]KNZ42348.1 hypothetical protein AKG39_06850 [Acetobacterium bakii]